MNDKQTPFFILHSKSQNTKIAIVFPLIFTFLLAFLFLTGDNFQNLSPIINSLVDLGKGERKNIKLGIETLSGLEKDLKLLSGVS